MHIHDNCREAILAAQQVRSLIFQSTFKTGKKELCHSNNNEHKIGEFKERNP